MTSPLLPLKYRQDIDRAIEILTSAGCKEVFVFGSIVEGGTTDASDIDLAIRGCPPGRFFQLLGKLLLELHHPVDLVDLDREKAFGEHLQKEGALVRVS